MADPAPTTGDTPDRRDRRRERRRRRARRVLGIVGGVLVAAAVVLLAIDVVRLGDDTPSLAGPVHASGREEAPAPTTTTDGRDCRPLSTDDPLRLWVGGDSLAGSLGPELGTLAGATGVAQPYFDSRVSSGLSSPGFFDWPDHATTEMARLNPEVVVFIIGANDWTAVTGDWKAKYADTVDSMMKTLIGPGRTVYWLGSPTLKDEEQNDAVIDVNAVEQEVAHRHPQVHYVDTYKLFSAPDTTNGPFAYDLPDETGKVVTMRAGDGVHLTMDGADYLARQVYKLVDAQCGLTAQKVEGVTKQPIETEGSTQVAPNATSGGSNSSSSNGSSGNYNSGPIQTTPPATAPPSTSPPVETVPPEPASTTTPTPTSIAPQPPSTP
jgi:hypothetical protein